MGCGRVGAALAINLSNIGHSVAVIDHDPDSFRRLPEDFSGQSVTGVGFDRESLLQAGIEDATGFAAVSSGDNSNIIAARVVRETFGLKNVVTRIYDPTRASVYERLGIPTVPTVKWTADQVLRHLIPLGPYVEYTDEVAEISLIRVDVSDHWFGRTVGEIEDATSAQVAYVTRLGQGLLPHRGFVLQDGDMLKILAPTDQAGAVQYILMHPAKENYS